MGMSEQTTDIRLKEHIGQLEQQLGDVLSLLEALSSENAVLKARENQLLKERSELHTKNDKVRSQVESMIQRLKTMEST
ncbi:MAG: Unknown protein [uncultured Thiotrichaceae bacterium]|uniref:TIGR02449 family protein n=1 Tax=uncultured Thiotrichaceae bacterium TaxID=298394 RepID=A0A6S6SC93_9GAMM|nr:MAG: Unknown protein [uncultured Thiotrichaceae bacterium]